MCKIYDYRFHVIYIDENVPTANGGQVPAREAKLKITYKGQNSSEFDYVREIPIKQAGLLPVDFTSNEKYKYTFYIEYYEEYLTHFDGKDHYIHTYDGLDWGFSGIMTGLMDPTGNKYMKFGWRNTQTIMQKFRKTTDEGKQKPEMTLNDKPRGATEYCYNKNKRNVKGQVEVVHWYHPTISELEQAMMKYYGTFSVFQDKWYWSSNPGSYGVNGGETGAGAITWTGEHQDYARATKVAYIGGEWKYVTSEANKPYGQKPDGSWDTPYNPDDWGYGYPDIDVTAEGQGGYANRNKIFRIRAVYIHDTKHVDESNVEYTKEDFVPSLDNSPYYQ